LEQNACHENCGIDTIFDLDANYNVTNSNYMNGNPTNSFYGLAAALCQRPKCSKPRPLTGHLLRATTIGIPIIVGFL
jgi:hypothetical protein